MTSPFSKILEKAFLSRLENHLVENNILTDQQHGFTKGKSTVMALFEVVSEIYNCLENKEKVNLIYDFSNAFGCLVPQLLILRLNAKKTNLLHIHTAQTKSVVNPHTLQLTKRKFQFLRSEKFSALQ
jgi:Reverse transcriptase (RNA-dependent DNA polymerase)